MDIRIILTKLKKCHSNAHRRKAFGQGYKVNCCDKDNKILIITKPVNNI